MLRDEMLRGPYKAGGEAAANDPILRALAKGDYKISRVRTGDECCLGWQCVSPTPLSDFVKAVVGGGGDE
jgi:hypothetical protein